MLYGDQLVFVPDGHGGYRPEMRGDNSGSREFIVDDDVLGKGNPEIVGGFDGTGKRYNDRYNPMRDWYWYDDEEAMDYLSGTKKFVPVDDEPYDNYYMRQMNDWRLAFHEMAGYTDSGNRSRGAYDPEEFDGLNREFSRLFTEHRNKMPSLFGSADGNSAIISEDDQEAYFYPLQQAQSQDEYEKMLAKDSGWWTKSDHGAMGAVNPFYEMMYQQVLLPSIDNLYKAQYAAALEQGYDEHFDHLQDWGDKNASTWIDDKQDDTWWMDEQFKLGSSQPTEWSMWYNDQQKDLGIASDANELQEQLATISGYTDRSRVQKDFLSQKAMVRYWMDQVSRFGGAQDLAENLFNNRDNQLRWASPRLATDDTIDSSFNRPVPWANAGEGVLPELTNLDMQLDDWWVNRLNDLNSENVDLINEFDPEGAFDVLIPPSDETTAYGSGTGG